MLHAQLPVDTVYLIDFVFKLQSEADFLIKRLVCLLKIFLYNLFLEIELLVKFLQLLVLFPHFAVFLFIPLPALLDDLSAFQNLLLELLHISSPISFDVAYCRVELSLRTVLQEIGVHLPKSLPYHL